MDVIHFEVRPSTEYPPAEVVEIFINGTSLRELVRSVELPFAAEEGHRDLAGNYEGPFADAVLPPPRTLLGEDASHKVAVLECTCGIAGCWPLLATITRSGTTLTWSHFEQPYRSAARPPVWRYDHLGPFVFDWAQYEGALASPQRRSAAPAP